MSLQLIVSIGSGLLFIAAAVGSYAAIGRNQAWGRWLVPLAGLLGLGLEVYGLSVGIAQLGVTEAVRHNYYSTLLLAGLLGGMGLGTWFSGGLRGLDGFLLILAGLAQLGALTVLDRPGASAMDRPWFISHTLAFQMSGACFLAAGAAGVAYLTMHRTLRQKKASRFVGKVASLESLERFGRWMLLIGFPLFTYGILTGFCGVARSSNPPPKAWLYDPVIVLSLLAWTAYAISVLCVWFMPRIRGRGGAVLATGGMALVLVIFFLVEFLSPFHR